MYYVCEKHKHTLYSAPCVYSSVYSALCAVLRRERARARVHRARARACARAHEPKAKHLYYVCEAKAKVGPKEGGT